MTEDDFYSGRDYDLFGLLAGVRRDHPKQFRVKGFPKDASNLLTMLYEKYLDDVHTPSYITYKELARKSKTLKGHYQLDEWISKMTEKQRLVFWFDN
jgi:transposase